MISHNDLKSVVLDKFLRYIQIDTRSSETSATYPSTAKQFDLARMLRKELADLGLRDATVDDYCYCTATLGATVGKKTPTIGLLSHLDTSPEVSGENVKPRIIENYQGGSIVLDHKKNIVISEAENPELATAIGHTLVTTDGTTLLGSDDKAGIAAIMTTIEFLVNHPEIPHGAVKIAFTPDEEIGKGVEHFDVKKFGADFAYTVDGGYTGDLNNETFSADTAIIEITGRDMHPGTAKNLMVNSLRAMAELVARLPKAFAPETTEGHEPYLHPQTLSGSVGITRLKMLLRDFTQDGLDKQKEMLETIISEIRSSYPGAVITLTITPTYRNMLPELLKHPEVTGRLERAVKKAGVTPTWKPIRGGTDGSVLTAYGLPTPNIFTGACNSHSLTEWQDIDGLVKIVETLVHLVTV
jgi:tripeptide aminopeptidase